MTTAKAANKKLIAITFDDGPSGYTAKLLDGLKARGVKATFFMLGSCAQNYPNTVRRVYEEGHQVCSHSYDHPALTTKSNDQIYWQMNKTKNILNDILGMNFTYHIRPPYGDCNDRVRGVLGQFNAASFIWSIDPMDWQDRNATIVANRIVSQAYNGAIVLCHDIYGSTVTGVLNAIDTLKSYGYEFVTVNELFRRRGVTLTPGKNYYDCKSTGVEYGELIRPTISEKDMNGKKYAFMTSYYSDAKIYYTTDGSNPIYSKNVYKDPVQIPAGATVRAVVAYNLNGSRSPETSYKAKDTITPAVNMPTAEMQNDMIVLRTTEKDGIIRYTTDNTPVTETSTVYSAPIARYTGVLRAKVYAGEEYSYEAVFYSTENGNLFSDVPFGDWFAANVDRAVALGIFRGVGNNEFRPNDNLTRGMFVTTLYRLMEVNGADMTVVDPAIFPDLTQEWYMDAVAWAYENGIVNGYSDGTFCPDRAISREEMCVILARTLQWFGGKLTVGELSFTDADLISVWAVKHVRAISTMGIILGYADGSFAPRNTATRAEAATVLLRTYDYLKAEN